MIIKKTKVFFSYVSEENWLNKMAAKGYHLVKYTFWRYHFEQGEPGAYEYRLELLENSPDSEESQEYLDFMEDAGIDCVDTHQNWVYFRKKATDEPFEIYTDSPSKQRHLNRIISSLALVAFVNLFLAFINSLNDNPARSFAIINWIVTLVLGVIILRYVKLKRDIRESTNQ